jgi:hypothetical protein
MKKNTVKKAQQGLKRAVKNKRRIDQKKEKYALKGPFL